jgi:molybdopterin converting factor small subunit
MVRLPIPSKHVTAENTPSAVTVRLFASMAELIGTRSIVLGIAEPTTVLDAFRQLCDLYPALRQIEESLLFAVNTDYARPETPLRAGDQLILIPPVSGGANS